MGRKANGISKPSAESGKQKAPDNYSSGYDFLLINTDIEDSVYPEVLSCFNQHDQKNKKLVLILITHGGSANVAYRLARLFHTMYEEVVAFLPYVCKSAGTLMVCAAHKVVMAAFGELGPLDVQLLRRDEVIGRRSGLTTRSALQDLKTHTFEVFEHFLFEIIKRGGGAVTFRTAADLAAQASTDIMAPIYGQINPEALGQDFRDLNVAMRYCERLSQKSGNLRSGAVERLVYNYPSHDFVIDLEEAKEIFKSVELPEPSLVEIMTVNAADMLVRRSGNRRVIKFLTMQNEAGHKAAQAVEDGDAKVTGEHDANSGRPSTGGNSDGAAAAT